MHLQIKEYIDHPILYKKKYLYTHYRLFDNLCILKVEKPYKVSHNIHILKKYLMNTELNKHKNNNLYKYNQKQYYQFFHILHKLILG